MGIIRSTFIIDADSTNSKAFPKARVKGHSEQVLAALAKLRQWTGALSEKSEIQAAAPDSR
jgi:hypothetical protein